MLIYTAVASMAPLHRGRPRAPPDMLSGGGREILASYTAFRYQGNFSDVTCRLMDTLPHQSPAARASGRKKLAGPKARTRKGADMEAGTQVEKVQCSIGDHVIYLLMTSEFSFLCVTDGFPVDSEAFAYLEVVEAAVSSAVTPLGKEKGEKVRKLASLALVESMNTWTSQANGGNLGPLVGRRSPGAGQVLTTGGYHSRTASPDLDEHAALERCLVEAVRLLRVEKVEPPAVLRTGEGIESTAESARSEVRTPRAQRPTPKGVLSPGPRGRISRGNSNAGAGGDDHKSPRSPKTMVDGAGWVDRGGSSPSESLSSRGKQFKGLGTTGWNDLGQGTISDGTGSASSSIFSGLRDPVPGIITAQGPLNTPAGQVSHSASQRELSRSPRTAHARGGGDEPGGASPAATASPGADGLLPSEPAAKSSSETLIDDLQSRLSLSVAQGHVPSLERAASMRNPQCTGWDFLSSTEESRPRLRMATAPAGFTPSSSLPCPPVAVSSAAPAYLSHTAPHPHQQQQQWSPPLSAAAATLGHPQDVPGMLSGGPNAPQGNHHAVVGAPLGRARVWSTPPGNLGPLHLGVMDPGMMPPMSPPKATRSTSDPPSHPTPAAGSTGVSDPKEYYAYRTTVAEERLRRRRLEEWEQQQSEHQRVQWRQQLGTAVDWEDGDGAPWFKSGTGVGDAKGGDDASPGCNSSGSASGRRSGPTQRQNPLNAFARERGSSSGVGALGTTSGACSPTSSVTSGGVGSPFRQFESRSRSSPLRRWEIDGEDGVIKRASSCSQSPKRGANVVSAGRSTPPSAGTRNGRSESVPPRPRSWTGARSLGGSLTRPSTASENDYTRDARSPRNNGGQQKLGILLPLDYSGMVREEGAGEGMGDASLLRDVDVMAKNALRTQVEVSSSDDDLLTVLAKFRHTLLSIPLPPPAAVDYEQALKDAQRESIEVNGRLFNGDVEELLSKLRDQVEPLVPCDKTLLETVCQDIVRASSRTSSGGDTYAAMAALLLRPSEGDLLTPSGTESNPIGICVDTAKGEVVITVENSFLLRRDATDEDGNLTPGKSGGGGAGAGGERGSLKERVVRKITARKEAWIGHGWSVEGKQPEKYSSNGGEGATGTASDEVAGILLLGRLEVYLCLLDGSSKRRLKITCPTVEQCPPECSLLGAGVNEVNGTYELAGFRLGAPVYTKGKSDVTIAKEFIGDREGWIIGRPPNSVLYGQPVDTLLPPELHWALMNGGVGQDPPPTLMMHYNRRAKEKLVDIREMPTPRQHWAIGPHVTFPERSEHNLVGSAIVVRPPTPLSPAAAGSRTPPRVPLATSLPSW